MKNRILLVGGGTGGHIVPVFNVYEALRKHDRNLSLFLVGSGSEIEKDFFVSEEGSTDSENRYFTLRSGRFDRHSVLNNFWQFVLFIYGLFQAAILIKKIKPGVIFSKGGYVSYPIVFWAKIFKIPYCIHESDIEMGSANRFAARGARKVFVGFPEKYYNYIPKNKLIFSGQLIPGKPDEKTNFDFGFTDKKPIVLITGGSLGASSINRNIYDLLPRLLEKYNVIHQVGTRNYQEAIDIRAGLDEDMRRSYFIRGFLKSEAKENLSLSALQQANVVISRAGATTVAEIARAKKPMILIPYPHASADHQMKNAQALKDNGACVVITEEELSPELLFRTVSKTLDDLEKMKKMVESAKDFFPSNGIELVCDELIEGAKK